jgi:putative thioredoxin
MVKVNVDENQMIAGAAGAHPVDPHGLCLLAGPAGGRVPGRGPGLGDQGLHRQACRDGRRRRAGRGARGRRGDAGQGRRGRCRADLCRDPGEDPRTPPPMAGLVRAHIAMDRSRPGRGDPERRARRDRDAPEIEAVRAQIALARQAAMPGPWPSCAPPGRGRSRRPPGAVRPGAGAARRGQVEEAVDELLELFRRDREWNDGAAKTQLFTIFDALKPKDPIALKGRRKL